ncbi:MFS family permease [Bradyrhizobium sp. S3.9.2]
MSSWRCSARCTSSYVDRVNIGTAASDIQKELGLSNTQLGLVFSAFAYPYLLFQVIGGWVGDRFGPRKTLFWCGMIWAAATISTGFVNGLAALFVARFALGFGEGATFPRRQRARCNTGRPRTAAVLRRD